MPGAKEFAQILAPDTAVLNLVFKRPWPFGRPCRPCLRVLAGVPLNREAGRGYYVVEKTEELAVTPERPSRETSRSGVSLLFHLVQN